MRPTKHKAGNDFNIVHNEEELLSSSAQYTSWYAQELIDKVAEYRVFVAQGKAFAVAQKIPTDPSAIVWNVAQGGSTFVNVKWGEWPIDVCQVAITAMKLAGLDIGGVDVIVERGTNRPLVLEVNSAPSLTYLSDGSVSYRQKCFVKVLQYILDNQSKEWLETTEFTKWQDVIHPALL